MKKGGSTIFVDGPMNPNAMTASGSIAPGTNLGAIGGVAAGGFACVVGIGALARRKMNKASTPSDKDVELKEGNVV